MFFMVVSVFNGFLTTSVVNYSSDNKGSAHLTFQEQYDTQKAGTNGRKGLDSHAE